MRYTFTLALLAILGGGALHAQERFLNKSAAEWSNQLTAADVAQRRNAAFALGQMGRAAMNALPYLKGRLEAETDTSVREAMAFAAGDIARGEPRLIVPGLEEVLCRIVSNAGEDKLTRRSAAYALGRFRSGSEAARAALRKALEDREPVVRQNAAWALGQAGEAALAEVRIALRDQDSDVKRDAANGILQMVSTAIQNRTDDGNLHEALPDLLPLCTDANSEVRRAAVGVLVKLVDRGDKTAAPALRQVLDDRDLEIRRNAALALSNIGGREAAAAVPVLIEAMRSEDGDVRQQATLGLRNIGPDAAAALPQLLATLRDDKDATMRTNAALAIGGLGGGSPQVINALVERIIDRDEATATRRQCASTLTTLGANDPSARLWVDRIMNVLGDKTEDAEVRERIIWAVRPHQAHLATSKNAFDVFSSVVRETNVGGNKMLRYDSAFMLGMLWKNKAPDEAVDVLGEFLHDTSIKIYDKTSSSVGGAGSETGSGASSVKEVGKGDGRIMATQALKQLDPNRFAGRAEIVNQLRVLAGDAATYQPLLSDAKELLKKVK